MQHAQDRDREQAERAAAVDERGAAGRRRRAQDRVQRHRERIGEHGGVVADLVGNRDPLRLVRGHARREPARGGRAVAVWMPGAAWPRPKFRHWARSPSSHQVAEREPARRAREPRVQHHALAGPPARDAGPDLVDHADHLVPEHLRPRDHRGHRVVERTVHEHLLVVAAAQPAQSRARHRPIGRGQRGRGISRSRSGASGPTNARGVSAESSLVATSRGRSLSNTSARMRFSGRGEDELDARALTGSRAVFYCTRDQ